MSSRAAAAAARAMGAADDPRLGADVAARMHRPADDIFTCTILPQATSSDVANLGNSCSLVGHLTVPRDRGA